MISEFLDSDRAVVTSFEPADLNKNDRQVNILNFKTGKTIPLTRLPSVQVNRGGNAFTLKKTIGRLLNIFPDDVVFAVGHGRDYTMTDLKKYHAMIQKTIAVILPMIKKGLSLVEIKNQNPLKQWRSWDSKFFPGEITVDTWIENIFDSYKPRNK